MIDLNRRRTPDRRHAVVLHCKDVGHSIRVVPNLFADRAAQLLDDPAGYLPVEQNRIENDAVVAYQPDLLDLDTSGLHVDLNEGAFGAVRVRRVHLRTPKLVELPGQLRRGILARCFQRWTVGTVENDPRAGRVVDRSCDFLQSDSFTIFLVMRASFAQDDVVGRAAENARSGEDNARSDASAGFGNS